MLYTSTGVLPEQGCQAEFRRHEHQSLYTAYNHHLEYDNAFTQQFKNSQLTFKEGDNRLILLFLSVIPDAASSEIPGGPEICQTHQSYPGKPFEWR